MADLEQLKDMAEKQYQQATTIEAKANAVFMVIAAHHARANRSAYGPDLKTYARHWLWAQSDGWVWAEPEVIAYLAKSYPPPSRPKIAKGRSDWGSA